MVFGPLSWKRPRRRVYRITSGCCVDVAGVVVVVVGWRFFSASVGGSKLGNPLIAIE